MNNIVFILGATATGKSDVAFTLAQKTGAEIVSCDSMQIYKEASIITSKPSPQMLAQIKHHFINIVSVREKYDVFTYYKNGTELIKDLHSQAKPVIVCGGTGLYAKALLDGLFEGASRDDSIREKLAKEAEAQGTDYLYQQLEVLDPEAAEKISPNDLKRIIRALEVYEITGKAISQQQKESQGLWKQLPVKVFVLEKEREALYRQIDQRVDRMCEQGAIEEVKELIALPLSETAQKIIGVRELGAFLKQEISLEEAKDLMKKNTRNYAKRQLTWYRSEPRAKRINTENRTADDLASEILSLTDEV